MRSVSPVFEDEVCGHALSSMQEAAERTNVKPTPFRGGHKTLVLLSSAWHHQLRGFVVFNFVYLPQKKCDPFFHTELTYLCYKAVRTRYTTVAASPKLWLENLR